jgi:hypothetical protein
MSYFEQNIKLNNALEQLPEKTKTSFKERDVLSEIYEIGGKFELTLKEIGDICEKIADTILGKENIKNFQENLLNCLEEDNRNKVPELSKILTDSILKFIFDSLKQEAIKNLVPEAQERVMPATVSAPEDVVNTVPQINEAIYEKISREQILRDLENPPPAKFSTGENKDVNENKKTEPKTASAPQNLPIEEPAIQEGEREVPIVRTMQRDIAKQSGEELKTVKAPALENTEKMFNLPRGKFGSGSVPQIKQLKISSNSVSVEKIPPSKNISIETPKKIETPVPTPKPISIPTPQPQINIEKVKSTSNPLEDKLTKMVHIPMENKKYEVDPYRESLDN